jgi:hypothetical protein
MTFNPRLPLPKKTEKVHKDKTKYNRKRAKKVEVDDGASSKVFRQS